MTRLMMVALTLWLASTTRVLAQATDAEPVLKAREEALLARNVDGVLALFADNANVTTSSGRRFTDKEGIRGWVQDQVDRNQREEVVGSRRSQGDRLAWSGKVYRTDWQNLGVSPLDVTQEAIVRDGKIALFTTAFTPESAARLEAARAAAQTAPAAAPSPGTLPRAGAAPADMPVGLTLVLGAALLAVGFALRSRRWAA